jgi:hypothetical protein
MILCISAGVGPRGRSESEGDYSLMISEAAGMTGATSVKDGDVIHIYTLTSYWFLLETMITNPPGDY